MHAHPRRRARAIVTVPLLIAVLSWLAVGCSSGEQDDETGATLSTEVVPSFDGQSCVDPVGDISAEVVPKSGTGSEPADIDLTEAHAVLDGDDLVVTFTAAGVIGATATPTFVLAQGDALGPYSFELRTELGATASGAWSTSVITWPGSQQTSSLAIEPIVEGSTLTLRVPAADLPVLGRLMNFGASAPSASGEVVFDECSPLTSGTATTTVG